MVTCWALGHLLAEQAEDEITGIVESDPDTEVHYGLNNPLPDFPKQRTKINKHISNLDNLFKRYNVSWSNFLITKWRLKTNRL